MTTANLNPKIAPETYARIDKLVAEIIAKFETTGDGPAALKGEREARKILHEHCPPGRRAVAKQELYARFMKAISPICAKMVLEDIAEEKRQREHTKRGVAR